MKNGLKSAEDKTQSSGHVKSKQSFYKSDKRTYTRRNMIDPGLQFNKIYKFADPDVFYFAKSRFKSNPLHLTQKSVSETKKLFLHKKIISIEDGCSQIFFSMSKATVVEFFLSSRVKIATQSIRKKVD